MEVDLSGLGDLLSSPALAGAGGALVTALVAMVARRMELRHHAAKDLADRDAAQRSVAFQNMLEVTAALRGEVADLHGELRVERQARRVAEAAVRELQARAHMLLLVCQRHGIELVVEEDGRGAG